VNHLENHHKHKELRTDSVLNVIAVCSNPARWESRYRLARQFIKEMEATPNVNLIMVETAFGDRHHEVTDTNNPNHLQLRSNSEAWNKESMINLGARLLPKDARYICWADADVTMINPSWALDTIHELQHFDLVQPYETALDLGPKGSVLQIHTSFGSVVQSGEKIQRLPNELMYKYGHPGFIWACTRRFWERTGGLLDFCVLGSADHHMAFASIADVEWTLHGHLSQSYTRRVLEWQRLAVSVTHKQVGFVPGRLEHHFHGFKPDRQYNSRWQIYLDHGYDPDLHLIHDEQGLVQLVNNEPLEAAIRKYNRTRKEDAA
jgi:hypothetical protein